MMDKSQDPITIFVTKATQIFAKLIQFNIVEEYDVGFVISFLQPDEWKEKQSESKSAGALIVLSIIIIFTTCVVFFSVLYN